MNSKKLLALLTLTLLCLSTVNIPVYAMDITPSDWAKNGIDYLKNNKIFKEDFFIDYHQNITRKDFAYIVSVLYEKIKEDSINIIEKNIFQDTDDIYVLKAYSAGLVKGYGNGLFGPYDNITREQIAVMLIRTLEYCGIKLSTETNNVLWFHDQSKISDWALEYVKTAYIYKIMNGVDIRTIDPQSFTTREQALLLSYNILKANKNFTKRNINIEIKNPVLKWAYGGTYPAWCEDGWYSTPAVADLNGDNNLEIIASAYSIVNLDAKTGKLNWRINSGHDLSEPYSKYEGRTWPDIIVCDVDNDSLPEIVTAHGNGYVSVYDRNGYFKPGWPQRPVKSEIRSLKVCDLDNNGTKEIIASAAVPSSENTWVFEYNGKLRSGWPQLEYEQDAVHYPRKNDAGYAYGVFNNNVSTGDLNGDGLPEIVVPSDVHYICVYNSFGKLLPANSIYGGRSWGKIGVWESLEMENKLENEGWGFGSSGSREITYRPNFAHGASVVADVDGNGTNEVIVTGNVHDYIVGFPPGKYTGIYIFNADRTRFKTDKFNWENPPIDTGTPLSEDPKFIEQCMSDPVVSDINNDGLKEILFPSYDGRMHCFNLDKTEHDMWPFTLPGLSEGIVEFASSPEVFDFNGDGYKEIVFTSWVQKNAHREGKLFILNHRGEVLFTNNLPKSKGNPIPNGALASPLIADIDGDHEYEIVINTIYAGVVVYDVPVNIYVQ